MVTLASFQQAQPVQIQTAPPIQTQAQIQAAPRVQTAPPIQTAPSISTTQPVPVQATKPAMGASIPQPAPVPVYTPIPSVPTNPPKSFNSASSPRLESQPKTVYAERKKKFSIYKPNRSQAGSAAQFDFNAQKESVFLELAKQVPNPNPTGGLGDNKFDWNHKLTVKLGLIDLGKMLLVLGANGNPKFQKVDLFHDPQKSYAANGSIDDTAGVSASASAGSEKKNATVSFSKGDSGYFLKVSIQQKNGKLDSVGVGMTDDEGALLKVLIESAVRRCYEW